MINECQGEILYTTFLIKGFMMKKTFEMNSLYDFYGEFLTEKQREIFELYYIDDLSLGEIAEDQNVSRQGVYDNIKRSEHLLTEMEEKLHLLQKQEEKNKTVTQLKNEIEQTDIAIEKKETIEGLLDLILRL